METRCPTCGSTYSLEVALNDQAGSELIGVFAGQPMELTRPLVTYLGLFRPLSRKLSWDRTLKLAKEVLALSTPDHLSVALSDTVEALREKQQLPGWKPLRNHNYLRRVLESVEATTVFQRKQIPCDGSPRVTSTRKRSIADDLNDHSWADGVGGHDGR